MPDALHDEAATAGRWRTDAIYEDMLARLTTARIAPGTRIKPADLQGEYGCSAGTVRDVLLQLSRTGVVRFELQRGFRAAEATPARLADLARMRVLLEQEGACAAMAAGGIDWEARLAAAHHRLVHIERQIVAAADPTPLIELWTSSDRNFHETMLSDCGSPVLLETWGGIYAQFRQQLLPSDELTPDYFPVIVAEHQAVLAAALARDPAALRAAIARHFARHV
ncbi:GntR family transcriptional regulator [Jannaschia sp. Os4]|uniref:GntR family transcriptional regulator n=1 Tax=Jannaschia sp. Os4 TaxID=2807617 RepID=UPI0019398570|nr:GntR family transcriptional regulator [Jannaschia sp. Os4]MBM2577844.1 GntR family transcriptional regulator [Jannaschia sp. Os4]